MHFPSQDNTGQDNAVIIMAMFMAYVYPSYFMSAMQQHEAQVAQARCKPRTY